MAKTSNDDTIILAMKKDGNIVDFLDNSVIYGSGIAAGDYTICAYLEGETDDKEVSKDITVAGFGDDVPVLNPGDEPYNYSIAYGEYIAFKLSGDTSKTYKLDLSSNALLECKMYTVQNGKLVNWCWFAWNNFTLNQDGETYIVIKNTRSDQLELSASVYFDAIKEFDTIAISSEPEIVYWDAQEKLEKVSLLVTYRDGTVESINEWNSGTYISDSNGESHYALLANTANGGSVLLKMYDIDGNLIDVFDWNSGQPAIHTGTFTLKAQSMNNSEIESDPIMLQITDSADRSIELNNGCTVEYAFTHTAPAVLHVTPEESGQYWFDYQKDYCNKNVIIWEQTDTKYRKLITYQMFSGKLSVPLEGGNSYYLIVKPYPIEEDETYFGTVSMGLKKTVYEANLNLPATNMNVLNTVELLKKASVDISYTDQSIETVSNFSYTYLWDGLSQKSYTAYFANTNEGDTVWLVMKSPNGNYIDMPTEEGAYTPIEKDSYFGTYTIEASLSAMGNVLSSQEINIEGVPTELTDLTAAEAVPYEMSYENAVWFKPIADQETENQPYIAQFQNEEGYGTMLAELYQVHDDRISRIAKKTLNPGEDGTLEVPFEDGIEYVICLHAYVDLYNPESAISTKISGNASLYLKKNIEEVILNVPETFRALEMENAIKDISATVVYEDQSTETLTEVNYAPNWYWDHNGYHWIGYDYLYMETSQGEKIDVKLQKEGTDEEGQTVYDTVYLPSLENEKPIYLGEQYLSVSCGETEYGKQKITVVLPEENPISLNTETKITLGSGESKAFTFTSNSVKSRYALIDSLKGQEFGYAYYAYDPETNTLDAGYQYDYSVGGQVSVLLPASTKYYLVLKNNGILSRDYNFVLKLGTAIEKIELLSNDVPQTLSAGLDSIKYADDEITLPVLVTYADQTTDTVEIHLVRSYSFDDFGNDIYCRIYEMDENGEIDLTKKIAYGSILTEGTYGIVAEVQPEVLDENAAPSEVVRSNAQVLHVVSMYDAAKQHEMESDIGEIALSYKSKYYSCALVHAEENGIYTFNPQLLVENLRIFDTEGNELPRSWYDDYTAWAELTGGQDYIIAVQAYGSSSANLQSKKQRNITEAQLMASRTDYIAGLDSIDENDFYVNLMFGNEDILSVIGEEDYEDGYGFQYEIIDTATGEKVLDTSAIAAGTYQIVAVQRTNSAIYRTGSAVYRTNSAIVSNPQSTAPLTFTVASVDMEELPVISEDTDTIVSASGKRQLYAFTPNTDNLYTVSEDSIEDWNIYCNENGTLKKITGNLTAGETYVICFNKVSASKKVRMVAEADKVSSGEEVGFTLPARRDKIYTFVPERSGYYIIKCPYMEGDIPEGISLHPEITVSTQQWEKYGDEGFIYDYFEAGNSYAIRITNGTGMDQACVISIEERELLSVKKITCTPKEDLTGYYAECSEKYSLQDLFDIKFTYSDNSEETMVEYKKDIYGYYMYGYQDGVEESKDGNSTSFLYTIYCYDRNEDYVRSVDAWVTLPKNKDIPVLDEAVAYSSTMPPSKHDMFYFVPETEGRYIFKTDGIEVNNIYCMQNGYYDTDYLYVGNTYLIDVEGMSGSEGKTYEITAIKAKEIKTMEIIATPDSFMPNIQCADDGFILNLIYEDGTSAEFNINERFDEYGNYIYSYCRKISNQKVKCIFTYENLSVSCEIPISDPASLTQLKNNESVTIPAGTFSKAYSCLLAFTPSETGSYQVAVDGSFTYLNIYFYSVENNRIETMPSYLEAGKTYVLSMKVYQTEAGELTVTPYRVDTEYCQPGNHVWSSEMVVDKAPSCTETGQKSRHCEICGAVDESSIEIIEKLAHVWNEGIVTKEPTCTSKGTKQYVCSLCNTIRNEDIPMVSHNLVYHEGVEPTCTTDGNVAYYHCSSCDKNFVDEEGETEIENIVLSKLGHALSYVKEKAATCTEDGNVEYYHCEVCGKDYEDGAGEAELETVILTKTGHVYGTEYTVDLEATCAKMGSESIHCSICDEIKPDSARPIDLADHQWNNGEVTQDATCTSYGIKTFTCKVCSKQKTEISDPLYHKWETEMTVDIDPTCEQPGSKSIHCAVCGTIDENTIEEIPSLEHDWDSEKTVDKVATCTTDGESSIHCKRCGAIDPDSVETINAIGHTYTEESTKVILQPTCSKEGIKVKKCTVCQEEETETIDKIEHTYSGEWVVLKEATCTTDGLKVRTCKNCPELEKEVITAEHKFGEEQTSEATSTTDGKIYQVCSVCGEEKVIKVLVRGEEVDKITNAETLIDNDEADHNEMVSAVTNVDNQALIDNGSLSIVSTLETKLTTPSEEGGTASIGTTTVDTADGIEASEVTVTGAAVTVASVVQNFESSEDETYSAKVTITDPEYGMSDGKPTYTVDISLYVVDSNGNAVDSNGNLTDQPQQLHAPISITMPIPEYYAGTVFELYHIVDGVPVLINYKDNGDGTITFATPSLSPMQFKKISCGIGNHTVTNWETVTESKCTSEGLKKGTCSVCYEPVWEEIPVLEHVYTVVSEKAASCTENGETEKECKNCGKIVTEDIVAKGHQYSGWTTINQASCITDGNEERVCKVCKNVETRKITALGHDFKDVLEQDKAPTCTENGTQSYHCTRCDAKKGTEPVKTLGHDWEKKSEKTPTCLVNGEIIYECTRCSESKTEIIAPKTGKNHKWEEKATVDLSPTCTESGKESIHCGTCGEMKPDSEKVLDATGHTEDKGTITVDSTCTEDGVKTFTCTVCEKTIKYEPIPKLGHSFASTFTVDTAPTCTTAGSKSKHCSRCNATTDVTVIPKLNHTMVTVVDKAATCGAAGTQYQHCTVCGTNQNTTVIPATGNHSFGSYVVTNSPTVLAEGVETRTCKVCGRQDSRTVAKLPGTIKLTTSKLALQLKKSVNLKQVVTGLSAGDYIASWKSKDSKIATVDKNGKVTGKKAGKTVITVILASGVSANITITVQKAAVKTTKISGLLSKITLKRGEKTTLKPVITPITSLEKVTYSTSNKKVVTVSSRGAVVAKASGTAKITVKSGSKKFTIKVTVLKTPPTKISGIPAAKTLKKGKTLTLKPKLLPSGSEAKITYKSSNTKVATVTSKGKITAKKAGKAIITVKAGSVSTQCVITVK